MRGMVRSLAHRGPDAEGFLVRDSLAMGMRRLSIIDLATGDQPIANEDGTLWVVFNGEIYNYRELAAELKTLGHVFRTRSDTEVIVHGYEAWGTDVFKRLCGMFAVAIYDSTRRELVLARDRFGVKPLYVASQDGTVYFGSEIKAILAHPTSPRAWNLSALPVFLSYNYLPAPLTFFQGIRPLAAASFVKISAFGVGSETAYWDLARVPAREISLPAAQERVRELFAVSVRRRMVSDVPVGAFLSGGMDSSAVVAFMRREGQERLHTYSVGFEAASYDETPFAQAVARRFSTEHRSVVCREADLREALPRIALASEGQCADPAQVPLDVVSRLARRDLKVVLVGDGGDELFCGYPTLLADRYRALYQRFPGPLARAAARAALACLPVTTGKLSFDYKARKFFEGAELAPERAHYHWRTVFTEAEIAGLLVPELAAGLEPIDPFEPYRLAFERAGERSFLDRSLYADLAVWLGGNNLVKVDTVTMAHGLEAREPFLDHELAEFIFSLPSEVKFPRSRLKGLMKGALADILPREVIRRKKAGWHIPLAPWFRGGLSGWLSELLLEGRLAREVLRRDRLETLIAEHRRGRANHSFKLFGLAYLTLVWDALGSPGEPVQEGMIAHAPV